MTAQIDPDREVPAWLVDVVYVIRRGLRIAAAFFWLGLIAVPIAAMLLFFGLRPWHR